MTTTITPDHAQIATLVTRLVDRLAHPDGVSAATVQHQLSGTPDSDQTSADHVVHLYTLAPGITDLVTAGVTVSVAGQPAETTSAVLYHLRHPSGALVSGKIHLTSTPRLVIEDIIIDDAHPLFGLLAAMGAAVSITNSDAGRQMSATWS